MPWMIPVTRLKQTSCPYAGTIEFFTTVRTCIGDFFVAEGQHNMKILWNLAKWIPAIN